MRDLVEENAVSGSVCYDFSEELYAMKSHLLALFKFTICLTGNASHNLESFVVLLHDHPILVETTELYSLVKKWKHNEDVQAAIDAQTDLLPDAYAFQETESEMVRFFKQTASKEKEEVRVLCWGKTKQKVGYFSFSLPEIVSTRLISLVATGVHSKEESETDCVNVMKFIPHGAVVPIL